MSISTRTISKLREVNQPIETSGFSPTQEEEGWNWISVFDADSPHMPWHEVTPLGENVTLVVKKLPFKTKEPKAERKRLAEKLVQWRVPPRDIFALWVSDSLEDQTISDFINNEFSTEALERLYKQFDQLSKRDKKWNSLMVNASQHAVQKVNERYPGGNYLLTGEIAKEMMTKSLTLDWIKDKYHISDGGSVIDLLKGIEKDSGIDIFVTRNEKGTYKTIPIVEYKRNTEDS